MPRRSTTRTDQVSPTRSSTLRTGQRVRAGQPYIQWFG